MPECLIILLVRLILRNEVDKTLPNSECTPIKLRETGIVTVWSYLRGVFIAIYRAPRITRDFQ